MRAAVQVEGLKLTRSLVGLVGTLAVVGGTLALLGGITAGIAAGNAELVAKAGPAGAPGWGGLLAGAAQVTAVAALLGGGVVLAWSFGREFADGTVTGLFGLPVGRARLALAKLAVFGAWALGVAAALVVGVLALGLGLGYGTPDPAGRAALGRLGVLVLLSAGVAVLVAWVTTAARSLLAGVGATIALVVVAQVGALAGAGGWMPFAAPALWALSGGTAVSGAQLALALAVPVLFTVLVGFSWSRLQLDR